MARNGRSRRYAAEVVHYPVAAAAATVASNTSVLAAVTLDDADPTVVTTGFTQPSVARCLIAKGNQASVTGDVVIAGTNIRGAAITETIASNGSSAVIGTKAFATVTSVTLPAQGASGDTISIGTSEKLGLPSTLTHNTVFRAFHNNAVEGTAPTVTVDSDEVEKNTVDLNTALNGSAVDIYYLV